MGPFDGFASKAYGVSPQNMVAPNQPSVWGNIDIGNRPSVPNPAGGMSSVFSTSVNFGDGKETLIPRVIPSPMGGYYVASTRDAMLYYLKSGQHLGKFNSVDDADSFGEQLHQQQANMGSR